MAEWKKVAVSGSDISQFNNDLNYVVSGSDISQFNNDVNYTLSGSNISQFNNDANYIVNGQSDVSLTGSFTGSFTGDGSNLTGVVAVNAFSLTEGEGISAFTYDGSVAATVAVSGAADLSDNAITKWNDTDGKFENSSLTDDGTTISGTTSIQLSGANSSLTGSFTGSFTGDGSGLTGLVTVLSGSTDSGDFEVDLLTETLTIQGTTNEIETSATGTSITIGLPNDVIIGNDLTVNGDLTVIGTASFQNTENLLVADRFVLFASGSNTTGDGGIVVQQGTQNIGELFGYDSTATRWGFTSSFNASDSGFTPLVYVGAVQTGTGQAFNSAAPIYGGATDGYGTIHVDTDDGDIWIYA
jgi:hypothetical protein